MILLNVINNNNKYKSINQQLADVKLKSIDSNPNHPNVTTHLATNA